MEAIINLVKSLLGLVDTASVGSAKTMLGKGTELTNAVWGVLPKPLQSKTLALIVAVVVLVAATGFGETWKDIGVIGVGGGLWGLREILTKWGK